MDPPCVVCQPPQSCKGYCMMREVFGGDEEEVRNESERQAKLLFGLYKPDYVSGLFLKAGSKEGRIFVKNTLMEQCFVRKESPEYGLSLCEQKFEAVTRQTQRYVDVLASYEERYPAGPGNQSVPIFGTDLNADPPVFHQNSDLLQKKGFFTKNEVNDRGMWAMFHESQPNAVVNFIGAPIQWTDEGFMKKTYSRPPGLE